MQLELRVHLTPPVFVAFLAFLVISTVASCRLGDSVLGETPQPWPLRTPYPLASGDRAVDLATAPPPTIPKTSNVLLCLDQPIEPVRVVWEAAETQTIAFVTERTGNRLPLVWPRGFSARERDGRLELVAPSGEVVARDGDVVRDLGGATSNIVCRVDATVYGPSL